MEAALFLIQGRVQGVGFRDFVQRRARALGLSGWVRNRHDGSVEAFAQGAAAALASLEQALRHGPTMARVLACERTPQPAQRLGSEFSIEGDA